ncbi:MAG: acyl carrier protein [Desulfuromonadaceae bacterium]|nr:acyl carrier protein [Desulfuromonadaceae bacterium]MDD2856288.1 acyl carrier protein [Desulfuromonadaceae bacterium]
MDIITELNTVFRQVFDDNSLNVTRTTTANDIDEWDSLTHMNLVVAVELKFKIKFALGELQLLKNVGDMADMIGKKIAA